MELITKVFLINIISIFTLILFDIFIFDEFLRGKIGSIMGFWLFLTYMSIPAWVIWFILTSGKA